MRLRSWNNIVSLVLNLSELKRVTSSRSISGNEINYIYIVAAKQVLHQKRNISTAYIDYIIHELSTPYHGYYKCYACTKSTWMWLLSWEQWWRTGARSCRDPHKHQERYSSGVASCVCTTGIMRTYATSLKDFLGLIVFTYREGKLQKSKEG